MTDITDQGLTETYVLALKASLVSFWCLGLLSPSPDPQNFPNVTKMGGATGIQTQTVLTLCFQRYPVGRDSLSAGCVSCCSPSH